MNLSKVAAEIGDPVTDRIWPPSPPAAMAASCHKAAHDQDAAVVGHERF